ncbi:MAG: hypothetical protein AABW92_03085 [Nanoarchaeota archaeon]
MKRNLQTLVLAFLLVLILGCTKAPDKVQENVDDINKINSTGSNIFFNSMQCVIDPWQKWYEEGNIKFIKAPSDEELITAYYSSIELTLSDVEIIQREGMTCQACEICPKGYYVSAYTNDLARAKELGWNQK